MPYSDKEYKTTNINYLNKDFSNIKNSLVEYAKSYFPNTYRDFNETSPGMMLIEMAAYVGDVLSFYVDQQYKEMMLPLAEERRNVINMANMLGYKVKPSTPAYVDLTVTQTVDANTSDINYITPDFSDALVIDKGMKIKSTVDPTIIFETLDMVDFQMSGSSDIDPTQNTFDSDGMVNQFKLTRKIKAIAAETKTKTFTVGSPTKFQKFKLTEKNVVEILSVVDSNNNTWYEVEYLAQDKVPTETYYTFDANRINSSGEYSAYIDIDGNTLNIPVPYSLQYKKTGKRFIVEVNDDNTTSLIFGNGVLRNGQFSAEEFLQLDQAGIIIPGGTENISLSIDPLAGDSRSTLGETPSNTTLTIQYRVGGGSKSNISSGDLETINSKTILVGNESGKNLSVTNEIPAFGGLDEEPIEEIRRKAKAYFAAQNRCVTQEDYEARINAMPAKFGNVAKVFVKRTGIDVVGSSTYGLFSDLDLTDEGTIDSTDYDLLVNEITNSLQASIDGGTTPIQTEELTGILAKINSFYSQSTILMDTVNNEELATLDVFILSYNNNKYLTELTDPNVSTPHQLKVNLKQYLNQYRLLTDQVNITNGKIVNFGVAFEVVAHRSANKADVKLRCINKIINYFNIDKMQFHQPLYTSDLEYELMDIDGVRAVNYVELTQNFEELSNNRSLNLSGHDILWDFNAQFPDVPQYTGNYGWNYDFTQFFEDKGTGNYIGNGVVLPSVEPAVFELKHPRKNVRGLVR
tara:strand:+ start:930 stop:3164 length:2235 start_codon:yes stop_codon:yes gene_type:complete